MTGSSTWKLYLLRCKDGTLYTGVTTDVARRVRDHATGRGARYTRGRGPFAVVHVEEIGPRGEALRRELAVKRLPRAEKLALGAARANEAGAARRPSPGSRARSRR